MDYTEALKKSLGLRPEVDTALDVVLANTSGSVWLVGGMVYRGIASQIYGLEQPEIDLDFIVEDSSEIELPDGWSSDTNSFGNPKLSNGEITIDFIPLENIHHMKAHNLEPTIDNYLDGTPLDVQSIAYNIRSESIIGRAGILAIKNREVRIHNHTQAVVLADKYGISIEDYLRQKADSLGFKAIL